MHLPLPTESPGPTCCQPGIEPAGVSHLGSGSEVKSLLVKNARGPVKCEFWIN